MTQLSETRQAEWQKSSYSTDADGTNCLELASHSPHVLVRESIEPAVTIRMSARSLSALLARIRAGGLNPSSRPR